MRLRDDYCCCKLFLIFHGIYLMVVHCFIQGAYGVGVVVSSSYQNINNAVNYTTVASNVCLVPAGVFIFWANLYESWKGARVACWVIVVLALFNIATAILYFVTYVDFKANSDLDKSLFWGRTTWIHSEDLPFAIWHILAVALILTNFIWFYYAFMLHKLSHVLWLKFKN